MDTSEVERNTSSYFKTNMGRRGPKIPKVSKLAVKLWELCKQIIRLKYGNVCYTCGRTGLEGSNWHTGHLWAKGSLGHLLKYDLRILRPQCYNCNINYGGQGAVFYAKMLKTEGKIYMNQLEKERVLDRQARVKADWIWFTNKIEEYSKLLTDEQDRT